MREERSYEVGQKVTHRGLALHCQVLCEGVQSIRIVELQKTRTNFFLEPVKDERILTRRNEETEREGGEREEREREREESVIIFL